ncbi:PadR family transcriptional regulator [Lacrimispora indolis]|uniref:PadR family transcriptional regulator n=1 Tax=Lacrimispora indolis TaxID=69825 RepID=UPI000404EF6D|nr:MULTISPECIES: PadR family transcriptional regulator [Lachnospiraceae]
MSLKHGMLGLLNYGPMTGYELDKAFKESLSFFWQAQTSQIYRELDAMEQNGWLSSEYVIQKDKPNKRVYSITDTGKKELNNWLLSPQSDIAATMRIKNAFLMRMFFAGEMGDAQALTMLRAYRESCLKYGLEFSTVPESIARYGEVVDNKERTKYWSIVALYGELSFQAGLEWVEKAIAILEGEEK